ncbi:MAG: 4Fe-4S dicluster domain-containing protein [Anaerolineales bacterium]|nr:4Fe-4S dicluster domain-containing protein [Anaerolineales bacterium]
MSLKIIPKDKMRAFVGNLIGAYQVVGAKEKGPQYAFGPIEEADELCLDYKTTILPPKKYIMPQHETLFKFDAGSFEVEPVLDEQPTVIMGVHTCDLHAIQLLDTVFKSNHMDQHYMARRNNIILVGIECLDPCDDQSFCKSMGTLTPPTGGYDLHLTDLGDAYAVDVETEKGAWLIVKYAEARDANDDDYHKINTVLSEKWPRFPYKLDFDIGELPAIMSVSQKSPLWQELGEKCLACGSCTNVCPTCYCFDVKDKVDLSLEKGYRERSWDSCQLDEFALVAGGHNFRPNRAARQRHRFFRKGKYQTDAYGLLGCVGCGRCARACLVDITPVTTFNELYRQRTGGARR